ncbi:MAG: flagellar export chaperone FlgN, partial [candidate division Zixibacteria bacterium]
MVNSLINIIGKEAALFERFLDLLEKQKAMLLANDLDGLSDVTKLQQQALVDSHQLSRERLDVIEEVRAQFAIDGDLTLSQLLELADESQATQLSRLR